MLQDAATKGRVRSGGQRTRELPDARHAVAEVVELVNTVVHTLHVLEDVRPGVDRSADRRQVPGLQEQGEMQMSAL